MPLIYYLIQSAVSSVSLQCNAQSSQVVSSDFYVRSCYFYGFFRSNAGGSIYINCSGSTFNVQTSIFEASSTSNSGGAFYFNGNEFIMERACGVDCSSAYVCQFFYACVTVSGVVRDSSMLRCSNSTCTGPYDCFHLWYGNQTITTFNSTNNQVTNWGGAFLPCCSSPLASNFLAIVNNSGGYSLGNLRFYYIVAGECTDSSIINNGGQIVAMITGTCTISNCIFIGNSGTLFSGGSIISCWIAHSGTVGGSVVSGCYFVTTQTYTLSQKTIIESGVVCFIPYDTGFPSCIFTLSTFRASSLSISILSLLLLN